MKLRQRERPRAQRFSSTKVSGVLRYRRLRRYHRGLGCARRREVLGSKPRLPNRSADRQDAPLADSRQDYKAMLYGATMDGGMGRTLEPSTGGD